MILFLVPCFYLTTKLSAEKESKSREGMKMMGLKDGTYYVSWILLYSLITLITSIIVTVMSLGVFKNVSSLLFFFFCLLYGFTFFGASFICVSILPT